MTSKIEDIKSILSEKEVDLWKLRESCLTEGGLVNDSIRRRAWPILVGLDGSINLGKCDEGGSCKTDEPALKDVEVIDPSTVQRFKNQIMAKSIDFNQIELDIARCTWHLLTGSQRSRKRQMLNKRRKKYASLLKRKQRRLGNLINLVLIQSYDTSNDSFGFLRYFQGYHDVSCIFLSVLGGNSLNRFPSLHEKDDMESSPETEKIVKPINTSAIDTAESMGLGLTSKVLLHVSKTHFRDPLQTNFENLAKALRLILMPLIGCFDPNVHSVLKAVEMEPFFALSWVITWFSHDVRDTALVKRLFDVFIVSHPLMPIYLSVAMVLHPLNRQEILNGELDFATIHNILSQLPRNSCSVGWKLLSEGEYVSGDEDSDNDKVSIDGSSIISSEDVLEPDDGSITPSLTAASMISTFDSNRVPFQELIDLAITFMQQVPPRNLIALSRKYYTNATVQPLLKDSSSIGLLQPSPPHALEPNILNPELKRVRQVTRVSKPQKRTREQYLQIFPQALVVAGIGPETELEIKKKRRRRRLITLSAILAATVAIACSGGGNTPQFTLSESEKIVPDTIEIVDSVDSQDEEENERKVGRKAIEKKETPVIESKHRDSNFRQEEISESKRIFREEEAVADEGNTTYNIPIPTKLTENKKIVETKETGTDTKQNDQNSEERETSCLDKTCVITNPAGEESSRDEAEHDIPFDKEEPDLVGDDSTDGQRGKRPLQTLIQNIAKSAREELGQDAESIAL